jgi:lysine 6-dehydrogenase
MVGSTMAEDLAGDDRFEVTVADRDPVALERVGKRARLSTLRADLGHPGELRELAAGYDIVLGAMPSRLGLQTLRAVIEAGKNYVDISFMAEDPLALSHLARARGVTAIVDCGVAPGTSNMAAGWATTQLDPFRRLEVYVGGLPVERTWPYEYKAAFAPSDVIEEYVRPARIVQNGRVVVRPALSEPELLDFPGVGTLEAFNTDGLRTLIHTMPVPDMIEKTMRYPGHIELMRVMRETGLFSETAIAVAGHPVVPRDVAAALLFPKWTYEEGEADLTVLRVVAEGDRDGRAVRMQWDLLDRHDPATGLRSMSKTTAFPATIMARFLVEGRFSEPGVHPPEIPGARAGLFDAMLKELRDRGVAFSFHEHPQGTGAALTP